jgi:hypothetical protein
MAITTEDLMAVGFASQQAEMLIALFEEYAMLVPIVIGNTNSLSVTNVSARVAIPTPKGNQIVVSSAADNDQCYIAIGDSSVTATTAGYPILPGTQQTLTVLPSQTHVAAITATTATLQITTGDGQ